MKFLLILISLFVMPLNAMLQNIDKKLKARAISTRNMLIPEHTDMGFTDALKTNISSINKDEALKNIMEFKDPNVTYSKWCILFRKIAYLKSINIRTVRRDTSFHHVDKDMKDALYELWAYSYDETVQSSLFSKEFEEWLKCRKVNGVWVRVKIDQVDRLARRNYLFSSLLADDLDPRKKELLFQRILHILSNQIVIAKKEFALHAIRVGIGGHINDLLNVNYDQECSSDCCFSRDDYAEYRLERALNLCCNLGLDVFKLQHPERTTIVLIRGLLDRETAFIKSDKKNKAEILFGNCFYGVKKLFKCNKSHFKRLDS